MFPSLLKLIVGGRLILINSLYQERAGPLERVMAVNYKALLKDLLLND